MLEGVGRRLEGGDGFLLDIGDHSLNGRERNCLFRNEGDGTFTEVGFANGADRIEDGRGLAVFDHDRDGRLDLVLRNYAQPGVLLHNRGEAGRWIAFELRGQRSNRDAVGARLRLRVGDRWQTRVVATGTGYLSSSSRRQHFGLGDAERVDEVRIEWPAGTRQIVRDLDADREYRIVEPPRELGSDPGASPRVGHEAAVEAEGHAVGRVDPR
jgi:hypothetical protein